VSMKGKFTCGSVLIWLTLATAQSCINGRVSPDNRKCECFTCFQGTSCDEEIVNCLLDASTNQAYVYEEYWDIVKNESPWCNISSTYRTSYQDDPVWHPNNLPTTGIGAELYKAIILLHYLVNNAITDDYYVVLGAGGTVSIMRSHILGRLNHTVLEYIAAYSRCILRASSNIRFSLHCVCADSVLLPQSRVCKP